MLLDKHSLSTGSAVQKTFISDYSNPGHLTKRKVHMAAICTAGYEGRLITTPSSGSDPEKIPRGKGTIPGTTLHMDSITLFNAFPSLLKKL